MLLAVAIAHDLGTLIATEARENDFISYSVTLVFFGMRHLIVTLDVSFT